MSITNPEITFIWGFLSGKISHKYFQRESQHFLFSDLDPGVLRYFIFKSYLANNFLKVILELEYFT